MQPVQVQVFKDNKALIQYSVQSHHQVAEAVAEAILTVVQLVQENQEVQAEPQALQIKELGQEVQVIHHQ